MWFKNLMIYRLNKFEETAESLEDKLAKMALQPITGSDMQTRGWVAPKAEGEPFVHALGTQMMICMGLEKKLLPSTVINQFTKARAADIEEREGYKPGRKQMKEIKEQVTDELIPRAFAIRSKVYAWIDPKDGWLIVDAASPAKVDEFIGLLMKTVDISLGLLKTKLSPVVAMTTWLADNDAPSQFTVDQDCELKARGDAAASVRYVRHNLESDEITAHIKGGKDVTRLAMTWADRISFVLQENLQIKRLAPLDVIKERAEVSADDDAFDTDFALMTGELRKLLPAIVDALGGEIARTAD